MEALPSHWRLFVAIPVPDSVRDRVARFQQDLRRRLDALPVRWTPPDQFHFTLRFLGDVSSRCVPDLSASLDSVAASVSPLTLAVGGLGCFPDTRRARVLWVGVAQGADRLLRLAGAVANSTRLYSTEPWGAPFHAHLTLGRIRHLRPPLAGPIAQVVQTCRDFESEPWIAGEMQLIRSELGDSGARHSVVSVHGLRGHSA